MRSVCASILGALRAHGQPAMAVGEIPCFAPAALRGEPWVNGDLPGAVLASLTGEDIPTFERAIQAIDSGARAWLGFKIVTDSAAAVDSEDSDGVAHRGKGGGSADGRHGVFLVIDAPGDRSNAQLVFGRPFSARDRRQMMDITRGPQMHGEQYAGLTWKSVPLLRQTRVFIMGAGTVSAELERIANLADFMTLVVDSDPAFLNASRFPLSQRILIHSFDAIPDLGIGPDDFVCVLTRGHMHDPQALIYGVRAGAGYVGMMGSAGKNERVFELATRSGIDRSALEATHTPIGLKFGARSPVELAISVVAELIQVRRDRHRFPQDAP
jgi:xanthine dehydrogenase accessory factor